MPDEGQFIPGIAAGGGEEQFESPAPVRPVSWTQRSWRPMGTLVVVGLALFISWHAVKGKHGLSVWRHMRAEDRQLRTDIDALEQENAHLRDHVERLKSDPNAIETEARKQLHYTRPGEVVYVDPAPPPQPQAQAPAKASKSGFLVSVMSVIRDVYDAAARLFGGGSHR